MKSFKIHLWFVINMAVLIVIYLWPFLFITPIFIVFFLSSFLLGSRKQIKEQYNTPLPKIAIIIAAGVVLLFIVSAFTDFTWQSNQYFFTHPIIGTVCVISLSLVFIFAYFKLLFGKPKILKEE